MRLAVFAAALLFGASAHAASLDGLAVDITNASEPVLCAEKDNVTLNLTNPQVRAFRIEAAHPAYIGSLAVDRFAPDWTACPMKEEALAQPMPQRITLYETVEWQVVGYREQRFWRASDTTVKVGDRVAASVGHNGAREKVAVPVTSIVKIPDALDFDRAAVRGFRLNIAAGTAVRFEPGQERTVELVDLAGARMVYGFNGKIMGSL